MEWNKVDESKIHESIQSISQSLEQVGVQEDNQWLKDNDNPLSVTLANGETLSMVPIPIPFQNVVSDWKTPSAQDVIIPDPCFDINDMLNFQCIRTTEKDISLTDDQTNLVQVEEINKEQIKLIRDEIFENCQSTHISPSLSSLLSHFQLSQWNELFSSVPPSSLSPSFLHSFLSSIHTPDLGLGLLQTYFPYWHDHHQEDLIGLVIKECSVYSISNPKLMEWVQSLHSSWNKEETVFKCINSIHSSFSHVSYNKQH